MDIRGIIWLDNVVEKLERLHNVARVEVEEVFLNKPEFRRGPKGKRPGEDLYYGSLLRPGAIRCRALSVCCLCL